MAQHPAAVIGNNNKKSLDPLRTKKTFIRKKTILIIDLVKLFFIYSNHSIDSLYSTNSVNVYVPSDNQQFRHKIARGW